MRLAPSRGSLLRRNRPFRWLWCSRTMSFIGGSTGMVGILSHLADTNRAVAAVTLQAIRGLGIAATDVAAATLIQRGVSREMQGRAFANFYGAIGLAAGVSYVLGGFLVGAAGPRLTFVVAGAGGLMVAAYTPARFRTRAQAAPATPDP